jgi:hypothetical protein
LCHVPSNYDLLYFISKLTRDSFYLKSYSKVYSNHLCTIRGGEGHLTLDHISILGGRRHFPSSHLSDENAAHHNCLPIVEGIYWKKSSLFFCRLIWFTIRLLPIVEGIYWKKSSLFFCRLIWFTIRLLCLLPVS